MASILYGEEDFGKVISIVIDKMLDDIRICQDFGHTPLIVTVSRRMPHILYWYMECIASNEIKQKLEEIEIITEIALPFIDFNNQDKTYEIFLIDDMVNTGNTFNYIRTLIQEISHIKSLKSYVIFLRTKTFPFEFLNSGKVFIGMEYDNEKFRNCCDYISSIITATLPIDVTYPLLYLKEEQPDFSFATYKKLFKDSRSKEIENYVIKVFYRTPLHLNDETVINAGEVNESYTSLLPSEVSSSLNNDFAKIRSYMRLGKFVVMPYAPNILSDSQLTDENLFQNIEYKFIWETILNSINKEFLSNYDIFDEDSNSKEIIGNRSRRSLVCVANYLYSLSSFNRILNDKRESVLPEFSIEISDLTLIVGANVAKKIFSLINNILDKKLVSPRTHQKIKVNSTLIPENYDEEYTISKYMSVKNDNMQDSLLAILKNARNRKKQFPSIFIEDMEYGVEGIMESFESLEKALLINNLERKVELYKWIDKKIDECVIVSRYAYTYDENRIRYWRRFFRMTSMELE